MSCQANEWPTSIYFRIYCLAGYNNDFVVQGIDDRIDFIFTYHFYHARISFYVLVHRLMYWSPCVHHRNYTLVLFWLDQGLTAIHYYSFYRYL